MKKIICLVALVLLAGCSDGQYLVCGSDGYLTTKRVKTTPGGLVERPKELDLRSQVCVVNPDRSITVFDRTKDGK